MPSLLSKVRHLLATATAETNIGNLTASVGLGHDTRDRVKALAAQKGVPSGVPLDVQDNGLPSKSYSNGRLRPR